MKQLFLHKGKPSVINCPAPLLSEYNVLVQVHYSFISSGTEMATLHNAEQSLAKKFLSNVAEQSAKVFSTYKEHGFAGTTALIKEKANNVIPVGYSCAGQIVAVGSKVKNLAIGDYIACAGSNAAYHADLVSVPAHLTARVKDFSNLKAASITTIGSIALQGIRRAGIGLGDNVVILGLGLLGQISVQLAKAAGARVFGIDIQESRLELAQSLGADAVLNNLTSNAAQEIMFATGHHGADITIITAASSSGELMDQAMALTRRKGKVVIVGDVALNFSREQFYTKEIDLLMSCSYGPGRYDQRYEAENNDYPYAYVRWTEQRNLQLFTDLVEAKKIDVHPFIRQEFNITDAQQAYQFLKEGKSIGIVLAYQPLQEPSELEQLISQFKASNTLLKPYKAPKGTLQLGVVGIGGFCKTKLLPLIKAQSKVKITALVDTQNSVLINLGTLYAVKTASNDYRSILADDEIHAVVIATPHKFHAEQALAFLRHGKAVFLEKPAATSLTDLTEIGKLMYVQKKALFCVDFNRPFSPFMQKIKKELAQRSGPCIVHYRMNAGYIPADHWTQLDEHGGRLIGEACHVFDIFCFLTDAYPLSIAVAPLLSTSPNIGRTDNVCVTMSMSDGSACNLIYTAVGSGAAGKEYMEINVDGKTIIMDDYRDLKFFGFKKNQVITGAEPDKGHEHLLSRFFKAAKDDEPSPIPFQRIFHATQASILADKLARNGGGSALCQPPPSVELIPE